MINITKFTTMIKFYHSVQSLTYLGVKPNRSTYFGKAQKNYKTIFAHHTAEMTCRLSAGIKAFHTSASFLAHLEAEYCASVPHLIDRVLNNTLTSVSGCLCPIPTDHLLIFLGILLAELY